MKLSDYIYESLKTGILSGRTVADKLTLKSLADRYRVSLTPVRSAVDRLVDEGVLDKQKGRLKIARKYRDRPGRPGRKPNPPKPPQDYNEVITADLIRRSLLGESVYLREEVSARRYNTTRGVVRQVFARLAGMGLLEHIPRKGWRLQPFSMEDLDDYLAAREALELKALELAWNKFDERKLRDMLDKQILPADEQDWPKTDNRIHRYILELADNRYISQFFELCSRYFELFFEWEEQDRQMSLQTCLQHREILEALIDRDKPRARKALSDHILYNHDLLNQLDIERIARISLRENSSASGGRK